MKKLIVKNERELNNTGFGSTKKDRKPYYKAMVGSLEWMVLQEDGLIFQLEGNQDTILGYKVIGHGEYFYDQITRNSPDSEKYQYIYVEKIAIDPGHKKFGGGVTDITEILKKLEA